MFEDVLQFELLHGGIHGHVLVGAVDVAVESDAAAGGQLSIDIVQMQFAAGVHFEFAVDAGYGDAVAVDGRGGQVAHFEQAGEGVGFFGGIEREVEHQIGGGQGGIEPFRVDLAAVDVEVDDFAVEQRLEGAQFAVYGKVGIAVVQLDEQLEVLQAAVHGDGAVGLFAVQLAAAHDLAVELEGRGSVERGAAAEIVPGQAQGNDVELVVLVVEPVADRAGFHHRVVAFAQQDAADFDFLDLYAQGQIHAFR